MLKYKYKYPIPTDLMFFFLPNGWQPSTLICSLLNIKSFSHSHILYFSLILTMDMTACSWVHSTFKCFVDVLILLVMVHCVYPIGKSPHPSIMVGFYQMTDFYTWIKILMYLIHLMYLMYRLSTKCWKHWLNILEHKGTV